MIFHRLSIENLGVFRGRIEFDLSPSSKRGARRPIILFGGMNGAGKTTVFEGFKLALYGAGALWPPVSREQYEAEMRKRLSRHLATLDDPDFAAVELELNHTQMGKQNRYTIRREWNFRNKAMKESLDVQRDGLALGDVEKSLWQDFIWDLIPPGLSRLFFFDGEKIQSLADDDSGTLRLGESFRALLGLDLVNRLSCDLDFLAARELKRLGGSRTAGELKSALRAYEALKAKRSALLSDRARVQSEADTLFSQVEERERRIAAEGGGWTRHRDTLVHSRSATETELESVEARLRELSAGVLPLAIVPDLIAKAETRINHEIEDEQWRAATSFVHSYAQKRVGRLLEERAQRFDKSLTPALTRLLQEVIEEALSPPRADSEGPNLNQLSIRDAGRVLEWFHEASGKAAHETRSLADRREDLSKQHQDVLQRLLRVPGEGQLAPMVSEFNALHARLGESKARLATFDAEVARTAREIESCERRIDRLREDGFHQGKMSLTLETARGVQAVLREFQTRLTEARIGQVTQTLEETFATLSRKKGWLGGIRVDPATFGVTILDKAGRELPKERLSAGEKQIYAVALLWALAKTSGRTLPFIIDTPLGRLDSSHRRSLVTSFLPLASEQVIVFSTDTEIDKPYFDSLTPHVARSYHLVHDERLGVTRTESGYFWRQPPEVEA